MSRFKQAKVEWTVEVEVEVVVVVVVPSSNISQVQRFKQANHPWLLTVVLLAFKTHVYHSGLSFSQILHQLQFWEKEEGRGGVYGQQASNVDLIVL